MSENIKKKEWEEWINSWKDLRHPLVPGEISLAIYEKLIRKYVKGKEALILGPTWQLRDLLARLGFNVTAVDISNDALQLHSILCKEKDRKEKIVVFDWLKYTPEKRFDLVIADAANFQFKEQDYPRFFEQVSNFLDENGVSIQLIEGNYNNTEVNLDDFLNFLKKATLQELKDYKNKAYYYLGYFNYKYKGEYGDIIDLDKDVNPFIEQNKKLKEKFSIFNLKAKNFHSAILPKKRIENYIQKNLKIIEKVPHGDSFVEEAFYWQYVMTK